MSKPLALKYLFGGEEKSHSHSFSILILFELCRNRSPSTVSLLPDDVTEHHPRLEESFTIHLGTQLENMF